jgi:hypothetical protein
MVLTSCERQSLLTIELMCCFGSCEGIKLAWFAFQAFDDGDEPSGSIAVVPFLTS